MNKIDFNQTAYHLLRVAQTIQGSRHDPEHDHDHDHDHDDDHDHNETNDNDDTAVTVAKATAMVVLFLASSLCGTIPFLMNRWFKWTDTGTSARSATVVKCLLYFGGGVLLCTTFLHLLPEIQESIENLQEKNNLPDLPIPLAHFLTCMGFFAMFLVEEIIHAYLHKHKKNEDSAQAAFQRGHSVRDSFLVKGRRKISSSASPSVSPINETDGVKVMSASTESGIYISDGKNGDPENPRHISNGTLEKIKKKVANEQPNGNSASIEPQQYDQTDSNSQSYNLNPDHSQSIDRKNSHGHYNGHGHGHSHGIGHGHSHAHSHMPVGDLNEDIIVSSLRGLLIVLALSLHELFEGLAVGLQSSAAQVWYMFGAVSAHKLVLAFCVGVELIVTRTRFWLAISYIITFAIVSPIGIGIGIIISDDSLAAEIPSVILQGLATGTLLYVVFFEILSKDRSGLIAYLAFVIGFFVMFGLQLATQGKHGHSHGGGDHSHEHEHEHSTGNVDHLHSLTENHH